MGGIVADVGRSLFGDSPTFDAFEGKPKESLVSPPQQSGLYLPNVGVDFAYKPMDHRSLYSPESGFGAGYKMWQQQSSMDKPFDAQWQSGPNGPQWVEPVRKSAGSWGSQVTTGPVKGNRI